MSRTPRGQSAADLVGVDFARVRVSGRSRRRLWLPAVLLGALVAAMGLAQLRLEILRLRYALGDATVELQALREERSRLSARLEGLRSPERLTKLARAHGLAPATRVIELDAPVSAPGPRP
jgi:hypothetical protein